MFASAASGKAEEFTYLAERQKVWGLVAERDVGTHAPILLPPPAANSIGSAGSSGTVGIE